MVENRKLFLENFNYCLYLILYKNSLELKKIFKYQMVKICEHKRKS